MPRVEKTVYVDPSCDLFGNVRVFGDSILTDSTLSAEADGQVVVYDSDLTNVTVEATDGQVQFRDAVCRSDADWRLVRPEGDPFLWTVHRTETGWTVHAGCVRGIDALEPWDATTCPDPDADALVDARQATFDAIRADLLA